MPRFIMKLHDEIENKDLYFEWSTIVDAPVTYGMTLNEFKEYYKTRYGTEGMLELNERLERVEQKGVSACAPWDDVNLFFDYNHAGKNETTATKEQIIEFLKKYA